MGGTAWSDEHYHERASYRRAAGTTAFTHTDEILSGQTQARTHDRMNPAGVKFRESRDSEAHPTAHAVGVMMDVTGSMGEVPMILQANLPKLMGLLIRKGYLEHPQILIGGIGDATCDKAPLQVGQFESGIEIEDDLGKLFIEGGGGVSITESYELAMYFMARHTSLDCFEKRGKRGYLFVIGDEIPYPAVKRKEVERVLGDHDHIQSDIPTETIVRDLERAFDVYIIVPKLTQHWNNKQVHRRWIGLLGQNVLRLEDPSGICEMIASTIGVAEGVIDSCQVEDALRENGSETGVARAVGRALAGRTTVKDRSKRGPAVELPDSGEEGRLARF